MSWKTDLMILGGLGIAGYLVVSNLKGIGSWLSEQIGGGIASTGGAIVQPIIQPYLDTQKWLYDLGFQAGQATQALITNIYNTFGNLGEQTGEFIRKTSEAAGEAGRQTAEVMKTTGTFKSNIYQSFPLAQPIISSTFPFNIAAALLPNMPASTITSSQMNLQIMNIPSTSMWYGAKQQLTALQTPTTTVTTAGITPEFKKFVAAVAGGYKPPIQTGVLKAGDIGFAQAAYKSI